MDTVFNFQLIVPLHEIFPDESDEETEAENERKPMGENWGRAVSGLAEISELLKRGNL